MQVFVAFCLRFRQNYAVLGMYREQKGRKAAHEYAAHRRYTIRRIISGKTDEAFSAEPMSGLAPDAMDKGEAALLHLAHEAGADEGIEAEVDLALVGGRVNGSFGFGFLQLGFEAVLPVTERGEVFGRGRSGLGVRRGIRMGGCVSSGIGFGVERQEDAFGLGASLFETELMLQFNIRSTHIASLGCSELQMQAFVRFSQDFLARGRFLLPVAGIHDLVRLVHAHAFDTAVGVTEGFAAVDSAVFGVRAVHLTDVVVVNCFCHSSFMLVL